MAFPGGKGKTYQQIINIMPPHQVYIEPFLGSGAVVRNKLPADTTIVADLDENTVNNCHLDMPNLTKISANALELLDNLTIDADTLIYLDPPYLPSTRKNAKIYKHEFTNEQHILLLNKIKSLDCMVIISGYKSKLYDDILIGWKTRDFPCQSQGGRRVERLWFNYETPTTLHDARYLGKNYRERQTIMRRQNRLKTKIQLMDPIERTELIRWLNSQYTA